MDYTPYFLITETLLGLLIGASVFSIVQSRRNLRAACRRQLCDIETFALADTQATALLALKAKMEIARIRDDIEALETLAFEATQHEATSRHNWKDIMLGVMDPEAGAGSDNAQYGRGYKMGQKVLRDNMTEETPGQ